MKTWQEFGLNKEEYEAVKKELGREPNELELALFGAMWSEHCSYKHTRRLLKELPTSGPVVVQGPGENAGVIDVGEGLGAAFKIESHNHPSALEPFQGAATGVGGIVRDIVSMGARPVALLNSLRLGDLASPRTGWLLRGIVAGMAAYGRGLDVPTIAGEVYFDNRYENNPLVNAMCIGLAPLDQLKTGTAAGPGNRVLAAGAPTGREGIGGAAFASVELAAATSPAVSEMQVGDPEAGRKLMEASLELSSLPAVVGIQDMGAAGLISSSCEMAFRGGCGMELELSLVPTKEPGMTPAELLLSESQERMLVVVKPEGVAAVTEIFQRWELAVADIGQVIPGEDMVFLWQGKEAGRIPAAALADRVPLRQPSQQAPKPVMTAADWQELAPLDLKESLLKLLANPSICSRMPLCQQFTGPDASSVVQGPGGSAGLLRLPGGKKGLAAAVDCNSIYCALDPREGTKRAVAEAARNVACVGAKPAALTNCLNFPSPEVPEQYWALAQSISGLAEASRALATPVISGNVSLYNEGGGTAIMPTPVIGMVGLVEDVERTCTITVTPGQILTLLGEVQPLPGGSQYWSLLGHSSPSPAPIVDLDLEARLCRLLPAAIAAGVVEAAHDVSEGGVAVTVAEMALAGGVGVVISTPAGTRPDYWLFSESPGAVVVALQEENLPRLQALAREVDVPISTLGTVGGGEYIVQDLLQLPLELAAAAWAGSLAKVLTDE